MSPTATLPEPSVAAPATLPVQTTPLSVRLLTVADYAEFPTDLPTGPVKYELNDGVLVVMAPPGDIHGRRQAKIVSILDAEAETRLGLGEVRAEVSLILRRNPDRVVAPDAAFILTRSLPVKRSKEGFLETIPEIIVEVRSKNDRANEVRAKKDEYFAAGALLVWVLDPQDKTVTAHRPGQPPQVFGPTDNLVAEDLLPGVVVPVAKLFAGL